jgi:hypothetical protein
LLIEKERQKPEFLAQIPRILHVLRVIFAWFLVFDKMRTKMYVCFWEQSKNRVKAIISGSLRKREKKELRNLTFVGNY